MHVKVDVSGERVGCSCKVNEGSDDIGELGSDALLSTGFVGEEPSNLLSKGCVSDCICHEAGHSESCSSNLR